MSEDPTQSWLSLAVPLVLQQDLATSQSTVAFYAKDQSAAYQGQAIEAVRTSVEERNGRIRLLATVTDLANQKSSQIHESEGEKQSSFIVRLDQLAKALDSLHAQKFSTRNDHALQLFTTAAATNDNQQRANLLRQAVAADPSFGLAQIALLEISPQSVVPEQVVNRFTPFDRARYRAILARIQHAPLTAQAAAQAAVMALAPHNVDALGELGWDQFLMGASSEGERLLREAAGLSPESVNLKLQLAQGLVTARRFSDAAQMFRVLSSSNPNVLPALASVQLLGGQPREADETFRNFANLIPVGTPLKAFVEGQWQAIMQKKTPAIPARISMPLAEGYTSFLAGRFNDAGVFWRRVLEQSGGTDLRSRAMLAASLDRAGQRTASSGLPVLPFLPDFNDPYTAIAFNEMRRLLKM